VAKRRELFWHSRVCRLGPPKTISGASASPQVPRLRIAYFVHDLNDAAVEKRLLMLRAAGFETVVTGFWRGAEPPLEIAGAKTIPLSRSFDSRLVHRGVAVARHALTSRGLMRELGSADLFLARGLEMLAVAVAAKRRAEAPLAVIYEVLDIHRLLLSTSIAGRILRSIERALMRKTDFLITSSPAFLRAYFEPVQFLDRRLPTAVIENKLLLLHAGSVETSEAELAPGPPWRIGWFGMIRCSRSLEILRDLARKRPDLVKIEIFGRPTRSVFGDFGGHIRGVPALNFGGAYAPADLKQLYKNVHFNWAIDYFEENANSEWLLPNRLYEGGSYNVVPFALRRTETGRWLKAMGLGVLLDEPTLELETFLDSLAPAAFRSLKNAACHAPRSAFIADQSDCDSMAALIANIIGRSRNVSLGEGAGPSPQQAFRVQNDT
jgi:succinoglycan biosynthesis protein ExoL